MVKVTRVCCLGIILAAGMAIYYGPKIAFAAYPLATDDAGTVKANSYELEAGYDNCKDENELISKTCGISFKHGVTEKMDVGISFPYRIDPDADENLGEATLGFKFSLVKDTLAVSFSNELGEKDYFINAICTKEFSSVTCSLNAGYLSSGDETIRGAGSYGISVEYPIKSFDLVGELQGVEGGRGNGLAGIRYRISEAVFAAAGASKDFTTAENKVTAGFHFEF